MAEIFIPTLHTFENKNIFTGSCGLLRFRIEPRVKWPHPRKSTVQQAPYFVSFGMGKGAMS